MAIRARRFNELIRARGFNRLHPLCTDFGSRTSAVYTANRGYYLLFVPEFDCQISGVQFLVDTTTIASSNDAADVGICDAAGTVLVTSGATSSTLNVSGGGPQTISFTATRVYAGNPYYVLGSFAYSSGTQAKLWCHTLSCGAMDAYGTTPGLRTTSQEASKHPLPTVGNSVVLSGASAQPPVLLPVVA